VKLGVMQPYFFPYLGYFDLINRVDKWIVFDTVKYSSKSWMNRNRILHPKEGWQYVSVPVAKHVGEGTLRDIRVINMAVAGKRIRGQLEHYRSGGAPFFPQVVALVEKTFDCPDPCTLTELNVSALKGVCDYLGLRLDYQLLSSMMLKLPEISHPGQWALEIADLLGASEYINLPGGRKIFRSKEWGDRNIKLSFTELINYKYPCSRYMPVEHLSVLDVLMWNAPADIKTYLDMLKEVAQ